MKYVYASIMLASLALISVLALLAIGYTDPTLNHGLHPAIAGVGMLFAGVVGFMASGEIGND